MDEFMFYIIFALFILLFILKIKRRWEKNQNRKYWNNYTKQLRKQQKKNRYEQKSDINNPTHINNPDATNQTNNSDTTKEEYSFNYDYSYMPYRKARLLTKTEHSFFVILIRQALLRGMLVCPKVRLEDIAFVIDKKNKNKYRGYIKSRHIDFVLINAQGETIAGIELDDPSHDTEKAQKTDRFKTELFKTIGVPLIRIKTDTDYIVQLNIIFDNLNFKAVDPKKPMIVPNNAQSVKTSP